MRELPGRLRRLVRADPDDRWAAAFGRIAVYSFAVALVTGILLLPFFRPSMTPVVYHGSYRKLDGLTVSRAYQSTLDISFDVRAGQQPHFASLRGTLGARTPRTAFIVMEMQPGRLCSLVSRLTAVIVRWVHPAQALRQQEGKKLP